MLDNNNRKYRRQTALHSEQNPSFVLDVAMTTPCVLMVSSHSYWYLSGSHRTTVTWAAMLPTCWSYYLIPRRL